MKALTLRHPWAFAIAYCGKNCENRDWSNELASLNRIYDQLGQQIAIHGGAAPVRPKRPTPLHKLSENNLWRQHCEDLLYMRDVLLGGELPDAAAEYLSQFPAPLTPEHFITPGIVAVATVQRVTRASTSPWAAPDHLHIELSDVIVLPNPVEASGKQGLWTLDGPTEEAVREELTRWSHYQIPDPAKLDGMTVDGWLR